MGPDQPERPRRTPWAELLARVASLDALACPRCGATMRPITVTEDPAVIERILRHLGLWQRGPPRVRR